LKNASYITELTGRTSKTMACPCLDSIGSPRTPDVTATERGGEQQSISTRKSLSVPPFEKLISVAGTLA